MKKYFSYFIIFIAVIVLFCATLTVVGLIPNKLLKDNVKKSANTLLREGNFPTVRVFSKGLDLPFDNMTDALMINTAYSIDNKDAFHSAMVARKNYRAGKTTKVLKDTKGIISSSSEYPCLNQVMELDDFVNGKTLQSFEYARYWHGYLIILRPLLLILNIGQIRLLFQIIFLILGFIWIYLLYKKIDLYTSVIYILGFIVTDYMYIYHSIQVIPVFLIATISSIFLLLKDIKNKNSFFLLIGMLTNFFDFLTVPLVTLTMPLLSYLLIQNKNKNYNKKEIIGTIIFCCIFWVIGYLGTWFIKWLLVDVIYGHNVIRVSFEQILYRTIDPEIETAVFHNILADKSSIINSIIRNLYIVRIPLILFTLLNIFILGLRKIKNSNKNKESISTDSSSCSNTLYVYAYFFILILGILWYIVVMQHSCCHPHYTYRNFWFMSIAILLIVKSLFYDYNKN